MSSIALCYGEEGERLNQLFDLTFIHNKAPCALLLCGDSGIGKSYVLDQLTTHYQVPAQSMILGELSVTYRGHLNKGFQRLIWNLNNHKKQAIIIEDMDMLFPTDTDDIELISTFNQLMTSIQYHQQPIMIIGTTRHPKRILPSIHRLFQDEIHLQIPTPQQRLIIMKNLCTAFHHSVLTDEDILTLSSSAHAFIAADMARWCRLAEKNAIRSGSNTITLDQFKASFDSVKVSGLKDSIMAEKPETVYWNDIGGLTDVKRVLEESAVWIYKYRHAYRKLGIRPSKGILLYGPPGTGKTMLAKAVATESAANFLAIRIPDLIKGEVGESEKAVSKIFQTAIRCSPCVIFLDELEAIFASRESSGDVGRKLISQFLIEIDHLDKLDQSVILLGATNHPESIDDSILRPGRLDKLVYVGAPNPSERVQILQVLKQKTKLEDQVDLNKIAAITQGYTGADLKAVMRKAGLIALKKNVSVISQEHIELAVKSVQPSLKESLSDGTSEDSEEWEDE